MGQSLRMRSAPHGRRAFTLVELLVVIAIISLLVATLLPALRSARAQGRRAACLAQLREMARTWKCYLDENNSQFLQGLNVNYNYGGAQGVAQLVYPPGSTDPIGKPLNRQFGLDLVVPPEAALPFRCPADRGIEAVQPSHYLFYGTSYLTNTMLVGPDQLYIDNTLPLALRWILGQVNTRLVRLSAGQVTTAEAELLLIGDGTWYSAWHYGARPAYDWHGRVGWHNLAFLDGHAAWTRVRRKIYRTSDYTLIPFRDLACRAAAQQTTWPED